MTQQAIVAARTAEQPQPPAATNFGPVWVLPTLVTLAAGLWDMTRPQLWRDELASWDAATRPTGQLFRLLTRTDAVSGAYYLVLHGFTSVFGSSTPSLRLPSVLAMAATAGVTASIGARVGGRRAGVIAGLLFAALPVVSRYAQEARGYAPMMLAFAVATWLLLYALDHGGIRRWIWYAVAVAALGAFNSVALATLIGHAVVVRAQGGRSSIRRFVGAWTAAVVALIPLLVAAAAQAHSQVGWVARPSWASLWRTPPQMFLSIPVAVAVLLLAVVAAIVYRGLEATWLAVALAPIGLVLVLSMVGPTSYWYPRYLIFTIPAWAVAAALAARRLPPAAPVVAVLVVAGVAVPAQVDMRARLAHEYTTYPYDAVTPVDYQRVAAVIAQHYRPGDGVAPIRGGSGFEMIDLGLRYYLPRDVRPTDVFVQRTSLQRGTFYAQETAHPTTSTVTSPRIWVVGMWDTTDAVNSMSPAEAAFLRRFYIPTWSTRPSPVLVLELLTRKAGGRG